MVVAMDSMATRRFPHGPLVVGAVVSLVAGAPRGGGAAHLMDLATVLIFSGIAIGILLAVQSAVSELRSRRSSRSDWDDDLDP